MEKTMQNPTKHRRTANVVTKEDKQPQIIPLKFKA